MDGQYWKGDWTMSTNEWLPGVVADIWLLTVSWTLTWEVMYRQHIWLRKWEVIVGGHDWSCWDLWIWGGRGFVGVQRRSCLDFLCTYDMISIRKVTHYSSSDLPRHAISYGDYFADDFVDFIDCLWTCDIFSICKLINCHKSHLSDLVLYRLQGTIGLIFNQFSR